MSTHEPETRQPSPLASLPRVEDVPFVEHGYDPEQIRAAFDAFQRHVVQLQAQLRVLQAAGRTQVEPSGHAVRMDALHLIRAAAEFADALERDSQNASAAQLSRVEEEIRNRHIEAAAREADIERYRQETERQRQEIISAARNEAREHLSNAQREASQELREAEARGNRLLEQARHNATELTNAARAEVEGTLEWARAQAAAIMVRAQQGAEQLLGAAGLGQDQVSRVAALISQAAEDATAAARSPGGVVRRPEPSAPRPSVRSAPPPAVTRETEPPAPEEGADDEEKPEPEKESGPTSGWNWSEADAEGPVEDGPESDEQPPGERG
ncbi:MAG: hypothetical protein ACXVZP_05015 [Gaiellaceae bacterium]